LATLATITARILNLLGSEASLSTAEAESLVQTRYEDLYESWGWSKRLRDFGISLVAQVSSDSTNTVTATLDSATVTSIGTPFTSAMTGRQITIGTHRQYFFVSFISSSSIKIQDGEGTDYNWPATTEAGASWRLFKTIYSLPATADGVVSLVGDYPMEELDGGRERLDAMDPDRITTNNHPTYWYYAGAHATTFDREIEVWPVPTEGRLLRGQFNRMAPTLSSGSIIDMPVAVLVYGGAADACHLLHAKQGTMETMWEQKALFFERKEEETRKKFERHDLDKLSLPTHLGRSSMDKMSQFAGSDYEVSHQLESP
jgi:hypothetical protein